MKKYIKMIFLLLTVFALCGCSGNFPQIDLQQAMELPEHGVIEQSIFEQIQKEDAVAIFQGSSNNIFYEWTIFGNDLTECRDINLEVEIVPGEGQELQISFAEQQAFGFPALLSIHLNDIWNAQSAAVYQGKQPVSSVSITGTKQTILNFSVNDVLGTCTIAADEDPMEQVDVAQMELENEDAALENEDLTKGSLEEVSENDLSKDEASEDAEVFEKAKEDKKKAAGVDSYLSAVTDEDATSDVYGSEEEAAQPKRSDKEMEQVENVSRETTSNKNKSMKSDAYLSSVQNTSGRVYSDGKQKEKDQYLTDPVPEGKPLPVEPEEQNINEEKTFTCTFSIECATILNNLEDLDADKLEMVPSSGIILKKKNVKFSQGESVFDVLQRICQEEGIHLESSWTPIYNSAYIEGINNLYEFDCGELSGWMYRVNGWYPNYGSSRYQLEQGDVVEWRYTCDLGKDIGGGYAVGSQ